MVACDEEEKSDSSDCFREAEQSIRQLSEEDITISEDQIPTVVEQDIKHEYDDIVIETIDTDHKSAVTMSNSDSIKQSQNFTTSDFAQHSQVQDQTDDVIEQTDQSQISIEQENQSEVVIEETGQSQIVIDDHEQLSQVVFSEETGQSQVIINKMGQQQAVSEHIDQSQVENNGQTCPTQIIIEHIDLSRSEHENMDQSGVVDITNSDEIKVEKLEEDGEFQVVAEWSAPMETEIKEAETIQTDEQKEDLPPDEVGKGGVFNLALCMLFLCVHLLPFRLYGQ
jgi:hypothetical protein